MQLAEAEAQAKLDDSSLLPLQFQNQRLETELDNVRAHSTWLEGELREKSEELSRFKSTTVSESAQARAKVDVAQSERDELAVESDQLREQLERIQMKTENLSRQLLEARQEASDAKIGAEEELTASRRLVDLQKEQLLRLEQKHDSLAKRMDGMKMLAIAAESDDVARWNEREQELREVSQKVLREQSTEYEKQIESIKEDVEAVNRRCKRAEDGLMLIEGPPATTARLALSPSRGSSDDEGEEPIGLMEMHNRVAQAEDALNAEIIRRKKAEIRVARIEAEIQASAPVFIRQRKEYEMAVHNQKELQTRMEEALDEAAAFHNESSVLQSEVSRLRYENKEFSDEAKGLAHQVRDMLIARSTGVDNPNVAQTVSQMQSANQRLLKEYRDLTAKVKDLEAKLQENDLHQEVEDYKKELVVLAEDRKRQEVMVESIVQQRDLYRALVNRQDTNLLRGNDDESSALAIVKRQSEQSKSLKEQHEKLSKEYFEAKTQFDIMTKDLEVASERLLRYESLNEELTTSIDRANIEISKGAAAVARSEAEAAFYKDKVQMLEDTQQRNRQEIKIVTSSKNKLMTMNTGLEQNIYRVNAECSKMEDELRQAKSKLHLAEAQTESAKAAEKRIAEESNQLRNELSRQGAVLDHVQRIESSLMLKSNADIESYKLEITTLKEKLTVSEKKQDTDFGDLKGKISDQEIQLKQLEISREKATNEALEAKKESLNSLKNLEEATKKTSVLEGQLKIAKKKLGETSGSEDDTESDLRGKLESITAELEGSKKVVDTWKTRAATYEKLAKDNEEAVSEMTKASNDTKKSLEEDITKLKEELERTNTEMTKRKEVITELTNDLSAQRGEREKAVNEVKQQISALKTSAEEFQKKAEDAEFRHAELQNGTNVLQVDLTEAQSNYERELTLHAAARTDLRSAREDSEKANRLRNTAMEEAATLRSEFKVQKSILEVEKSKREETEQNFEKRIESSSAENSLLHTQLEKINEQIEKMNSRNTEAEGDGEEGKTEDVSGDEETMKLRNTVSELREIVKFVRTEKDAIQGQLDASRRTIERERTKLSTARRAAEEAQAELKGLQESSKETSDDASEGGTSMADKLKATGEQSRLLGDSNAHLQQQVQELQNNLTIIRQELETSKSALQPAVNGQKELESDKAALLAEKESLLREIEDWKGRVQSLVTRFNQVDPEEHSKLVKEKEDLEKQVQMLEQKSLTAENDAKRIRALASRASAQLTQNKQTVEDQKKTISKLNVEKETLEKSQKESTSKKDMDEMMEKLTKLEKELESEKIQTKGAIGMNEKLRDMLRRFQQNIKELKLKEVGLNKQLVEARSKIAQKEVDTAKAMAALKQEKEKKQTATGTAAAATTTTTTKAPTKSSVVEPTSAPAPVPAKKISTSAITEKQSVSTTPASTQSKAVIEKKEEKVMPQVPPGGFKFAPSKISTTRSPSKEVKPKQQLASKVVQKQNASIPEKNGIEISSKKRPAKEIVEGEAPVRKKNPIAAAAAALGLQNETQRKQVDPEGDAKTQIETVAPATNPKSPPPPGRRTSGESKEMSFKLKLLERKRKLAMKMKELEEKQSKQEVSTEPECTEPDAKRNKTETTSIESKSEGAGISKPQTQSTAPPVLDPKASSFVPGSSSKPPQAALVSSNDKKETVEDDDEDGEMEESEEATTTTATTTEGTKPKGDTSTVGLGGSSTSSIFGGGTTSMTAKSIFGGGSASPSGFGQGSSSTTTFGQSSGFGGGSGFGSSTKTPSAFGGTTNNDTNSSGFGSSSSSSGFGAPSATVAKTPLSTSGFGGSSSTFLDIKPPGAGSARQFSFGSGGSSITLPTPGTTTTNPQMNMFNAFSSPAGSSQPFGSGGGTTGGQIVATKPLFGQVSTDESKIEEEEEEQEEQEEGEM
jgi:nucleoprotein TPR